MLPIVLALETVSVGLAGIGDGFARREALLAEAGVTPVLVTESDALPDIRVLFIAGLDRDASTSLAGRAHSAGILVNVEDVPEFCDFHVPAIVRRGDLVLTASTGGRAPGLARRLREWLQERFGPEWTIRLEDVSQARAGWRADGLPPVEVAKRTRDMISEKGWL
ncbi:MAG: precorrin-2 dehydrogenase/sirohydrochlorin ferrochelatase family protein [Rhizomicrobium sp.]